MNFFYNIINWNTRLSLRSISLCINKRYINLLTVNEFVECVHCVETSFTTILFDISWKKCENSYIIWHLLSLILSTEYNLIQKIKYNYKLLDTFNEIFNYWHISDGMFCLPHHWFLSCFLRLFEVKGRKLIEHYLAIYLCQYQFYHHFSSQK